MPTLILRNLNPEFWSRVQAKATAEGTTPKAVILKLLAQWLGVLLLALLSGACTSPYEPTPLPANPVVVTPPPTSNPGGPAVEPLVVSLSVGRTSPSVGDAISFIADTRTTITRAAWEFGNGATATTAENQTAYAYPATGTFTARVTVTASDGRTGSDTQTVTVRNQPPGPPPAPPPPPPAQPVLTVELTCAAKPALTPTPCNVTASYGGTVQPSSQTTSVVWDFGDGPPPVTTPGPVVSHPYPQAGSYTVFATATVQTVDGPKTATASKTLLVP